MNYLSYVMMIGLAALAVAGVCCAALWVMLPAMIARARTPEEAPGPLPAAPAPAPSPARQAAGPQFDFTPEQAPEIAEILAKESPEDIGTVLWHLSPEAGRALLAALPPAQRSGALLSLAAPREVDMDFVRGVKRAIADRLYGRIGGAQRAAALAGTLPYGERKTLLDGLCAADAARGAAVRALFVLDEDLLDMPDKDMAALAAAVPPRTMAAFLPAMPGKLHARVMAAYPAKDAPVLEKAPAVYEKKEAEARLGEFMDMVEKLCGRGVIARPKPKTKAAPAAAAKPVKDDWG